MGLGGALTESIEFRGGRLLNGNFKDYHVPRFKDVPELDIVLLDDREVPSAGAGETPIIAVAPAIANALYDITGRAFNKLPLTL
jgi:nicotinate dehydrogenase subunit B